MKLIRIFSATALLTLLAAGAAFAVTKYQCYTHKNGKPDKMTHVTANSNDQAVELAREKFKFDLMGAVFAFLFALLSFLTAGTSFAAETTHTNSIGMEFILVPAGSFTMGADKNFEGASDHETPQHRVTISKPFYLGKFEVTQTQWVAVMGNNPSKFKGRSNPVEQVSWDDIQVFIQRLNAMEGHNRYRLPTEAEWEYAARAGTESIYSFGDDAYQLGNYAWYTDNSSDTTRPVGQKQPNPWGFYDMHGNVYEWVQDWYGDNYYSGSSDVDPQGPSSGLYRVVRGGSWDGDAGVCRSARRYDGTPDSRGDFTGFRLALSPGQ